MEGPVVGAVVAPVSKNIIDRGIEAIEKHTGYCIHYKKNVKSLHEKVKVLLALRTEIQENVTTAKKNLDSIKINVENWLKNVNKEMEDTIMVWLMNFINDEEAIMFNHDQCCTSWCCLLNRHKIGRRAHKKTVVVEGLFNDGKKFDSVSYPSADLLASVITQSISTDGNVAFASRESIMNEIMSALKDDETFSVGIYGMGGIGKTMLKNRVHKQLVEEKLFTKVATTTVSQNVSVKKIQHDIAQSLGFDKVIALDDTTPRAAVLLDRLKQEDGILIVLDDLWTINPNLFVDVGIPYRCKGCKILITTRNPEVCNSLKIQKIIEVKVLSEDESWHLFKQNAGDVVDSFDLQTVAREVVKECGSLPLALVTVGSALQNKDKHMWEYTAKQLRKSDFAEIEGMTSNVNASIRLSYDYLGNDILKRCFLLCCLFPEDKRIHVEDLLIYAIGDEVIRGDLETLVEVTARLHNAFTKLFGLGLLIRIPEFPDPTFSAKMHDIVRDVAISIASADGNRFYVKAGLRLQNWPEAGSSMISKCSRLSLIHNDITGLPDQPELPHLLSLSLGENRFLKKIPDRFFENMIALQSLDISKISISTLPSSISYLVNLRSLDMGNCTDRREFNRGVVPFEELKKLEELNLASWQFSNSLPKEIGGLSRLKLLDPSGNEELTVEPGIISRLNMLDMGSYRFNTAQLDISALGELKKLEILNLAGLELSISLPKEIGGLSRLKWLNLSGNKELTVEPGIISRLKCLEYLDMECSFQGWEVGESRGESCRFANLDEIASLPCLQTLALVVKWGDAFFQMYTGGRHMGSEFQQCKLRGTSTFCNSIKLLVAKSRDFSIAHCPNIKSLISLVTSSTRRCWFNGLKDLRIDHCNQMECVLNSKTMGQLSEEFSLGNLKSLELYNCPNLVYIFSLEVWLTLKNLEQLRVRRCNRLKEVFPLEDESGLQVSNDQKQKQVLCLGNLKSVEVRDCNELKYLFTPSMVLRNLKSVKVRNCNELKYSFNPSMVLRNLELKYSRLFNS